MGIARSTNNKQNGGQIRSDDRRGGRLVSVGSFIQCHVTAHQENDTIVVGAVIGEYDNAVSKKARVRGQQLTVTVPCTST